VTDVAPLEGGRVAVGTLTPPRPLVFEPDGTLAATVGLVPMRRADHGPEALRPRRAIPGRRWLVFGPDGALTAHVSTPEGFEPYAVREGRMWGVYTDEVDVESIRAYRLKRGRGVAAARFREQSDSRSAGPLDRLVLRVTAFPRRESPRRHPRSPLPE
jgi:hypothetical protein